MTRTGLYFKVKEPSLRKFFAGATSYNCSIPNRVWMLLQFPSRYNRIYGSVTRTFRPVDHRDREAYAFNVRYALFAVYAEWPEVGRQKMNLLQDAIGTDDISAWERVTSHEEIVATLIAFDI